ncbi:chemotaxis protein CheA [Achromobacter sp. F4_2707]|uniref:chemotaxis protein CheA n=1 Tax=Achromobacter sp. F4_2707 TaxID=3114286 RepID=UPI0039C6D59E
MSAGVDLSQFFDTFFDEADELLTDMEQLLLNLDVDNPDIDQLNGIFRAAHSIKGGAGTFGCFGMLADTTHLLENLLDYIRRDEMVLRKDMIDLFLETKDVLMDQVAAYRNQQEPSQEAYDRICAQLRALAEERHGGGQAAAPEPAAAAPAPEPTVAAPEAQAPAAAPAVAATGDTPLKVKVSRLKEADMRSLATEMALMGEVLHEERTSDSVTFWLKTATSQEDIAAVCCFIVNEDQVEFSREAAPVAAPAPAAAPVAASAPAAPAASEAPAPAAEKPAEKPNPKPAAKSAAASMPTGANTGSSTIRVGVEKVDQIINLVGELVITQAMLVQTASTLDPVLHDRLLNGIEQLDRNARDLQEAVMSIRMVPMDFVFSRFPRVVREAAAKMGKNIRLVTQGAATELDKSLIERIIDPLTHLVRNSIDHGVESPERRLEVGKSAEGTITMAAQHHGGQIVIEVRDDGAGLNREKILKKAMAQGFPVNESTPDEEIWPLIFAPGFSTAEQVTEISGRGVGMDVVRRNIQGMGGHIQIFSKPGEGSTIRIVLPLTLAILDGMSVRVGDEVFILPLSNVTESMQPTADQIHSISESERVLQVRGDYLPLVELHEVFDVKNAEKEITKAIAVILQVQDVRFALLVDHLVGQHQVVVKNLEANYKKIPGVSAATILGDGSVALIVDVFALMQTSQNTRTATV